MNHYRIAALTFAMLLNSAIASAQPKIFNQIIDAATQANKQGQPTTSSKSVVKGAAISQNFEPWRGDATPAYSSKELLLAAVRRGDLAGIGDIVGSFDRSDVTADFKPVAASIAVILADELGTPIPNDHNKGSCQKMVDLNLLRAIHAVTTRYTRTLSNRGPEFRNPPRPSDSNDKNFPAGFSSISAYCSQMTLGQKRPYPMVESLQHLLEEYGAATGEYVEEKRAALIQNYQAQELAKEDAKNRQEAERKAAEQRQIDAERQRIEEQQRKRKEADSKRISG